MKIPGKLSKLLWSPIGVAVMLFTVMFLGGSLFFAIVDSKPGSSTRGPTVEDFRQQFIARLDEDLADPQNFIRRKIENAHWTVKTTSARVTACSVYSVDGTDRAGKDYSNIGDIDFIVTAFWDGVLQKGGYTEIRMTVDARSGQLKSCAYVGGNAAFNAETIDWFEVGKTAAPYVLSLVGG